MSDDYTDAYTYAGKSIHTMVVDEVHKYRPPNYYMRRKHGKWTIYNKDRMRVAWGLNEREANAYMKLLKEEN
jgi:hypothetical protein